MAAIAELVYREWHELKSDLVYDLFGERKFHAGHFLFRGHMNSEWRLEASFDRWFEQLTLKSDRITIAEKLLESFRHECEKLELRELVQSDAAALALGQHYGLPTRLLDWSESPYVAAFFAFSDAVTLGATNDDIAIWALHLKSPVWNKEIGVEIVTLPYTGNTRMRNQVGKFTLLRSTFSCLEEHVENSITREPSLTRIVLPVGEAKVALADLNSMGINPSLVYPEILGCTMAAKMSVMLEIE